MIDLLVVFVLTLLIGGISIPVGILMGIEPVGVYLAATTGSLSFMTLVLALGGRGRHALVGRLVPGLDDRLATSRASTIVAKWGAAGLALVGGLVLGPTITLGAAVVLDVDRKQFTLWYVASTVIGFALITMLWAALL